MIDALSRLLERKDWNEITIEDVVEEANLSVGAFYKRFRSRNEILNALLLRTQRDLDQEATALTAGQGDLSERIGRLVAVMAEGWRSHRHIIRAAAGNPSLHRSSTALLEESKSRLRCLANWLLERREEINHPNPELAVSIGLYFVMLPLQSALLQDAADGAPTSEPLQEEAARMLYTYLTTGQP